MLRTYEKLDVTLLELGNYLNKEFTFQALFLLLHILGFKGTFDISSFWLTRFKERYEITR